MPLVLTQLFVAIAAQRGAKGDATKLGLLIPAVFFGLLGGGKQDPGWDGSGRPASRLAILPGLTHYNIFSAPALASTVIPFLDEPAPKGQ